MVTFEIPLNAMDVIIIDRQFCGDSNETYGLDYPELLQSILDEYSKYETFDDAKEKTIQKACCIMVGLVFHQPFKNGNKRTAVSISLIMMKDNGFKIKGYETEEVQEEFYDLLDKTMMKMEGDESIKPDLENYLRENLIKI